MSFNLKDIGNEVQGRGYGWQAGLAGSPRHSFPTALQLFILEITLQLRGAARRPGLAFFRVLELTGCAIATPRPQQSQRQYSRLHPLCVPLPQALTCVLSHFAFHSGRAKITWFVHPNLLKEDDPHDTCAVCLNEWILLDRSGRSSRGGI